MSLSIYQFTYQKLFPSGVGNDSDKKIIFRDKYLFLLFVKLERARRLECFDAVHAAVSNIENYLKKIGKRHLMIFAYSYLYFFSDGTPNLTERDEVLNNGDIRKCKIYKKPATEEEIMIASWAGLKYRRYGPYFYRALEINRSKINWVLKTEKTDSA